MLRAHKPLMESEVSDGSLSTPSVTSAKPRSAQSPVCGVRKKKEKSGVCKPLMQRRWSEGAVASAWTNPEAPLSVTFETIFG